MHSEYSSLREEIRNVGSAFLIVVGNIVDLYTTDSLIFTRIYLVCLLLTSYVAKYKCKVTSSDSYY